MSLREHVRAPASDAAVATAEMFLRFRRVETAGRVDEQTSPASRQEKRSYCLRNVSGSIRQTRAAVIRLEAEG